VRDRECEPGAQVEQQVVLATRRKPDEQAAGPLQPPGRLRRPSEEEAVEDELERDGRRRPGVVRLAGEPVGALVGVEGGGAVERAPRRRSQPGERLGRLLPRERVLEVPPGLGPGCAFERLRPRLERVHGERVRPSV
jgi:hypothetical protein